MDTFISQGAFLEWEISWFPLSSLVTDTQESLNKIQPDQPTTIADIVANCDLMEGGQDLCDSGNWLCHRILLNYYKKSPNTVTID